MISVGETLRRERLRTGLDLHVIAEETKISVRMLELIEADQFEKLPGGVFARSFVRQYARALGLDEDEIVAEFQKMVEPDPAGATPAEEPPPEPVIRMTRAPQWGSGKPNSSFSALAAMVVVVVICSLIYNWWQRPRSEPAASSTPKPVATMPAQQPATPPPAPASTGPDVAAKPAQSDQASAPAAESPQAANRVAAESTAAGAVVRIALIAEEATWISATSNGKSVFVGTLQPKQTKELAAADSVKLVIGNAGGIEITLNGKPIPPVGPKGQVRVVQLTRDGEVQVIPPKPPAPQPL